MKQLTLNRVAIKFNITFGWKLVTVHTTPFMFGRFLGACLKLVCRFERRTFNMGLLSVKLFLACQEVQKWVWHSMNQNRLLFSKIQALLPPSMHHKWINIFDVILNN
jgi:hypothetical protein